ncbi:MAG: ParM/StbA family protein [Oscillospiraceae bacterium]
MIKGIDIGYTYTKDETKNRFKTAFTMDDSIVSGAIRLRVNNETYYVGDGKGTVELDKAETDINRICLLADLALCNANDFYIVSGLPVGQFKQQEDKLKNFILKQSKSYISINDQPIRQITINDVKIFPQGVGALYSQDIKGNVLIVDIGGRTIDVALIEMQYGKPKLQKNNTWFHGMLVLYSKIVDAVNRKFETTLEPRYAEDILTKGLEIYSQKQNLDFLKPIIQDHFEEIFTELRLNYPTKTTPIYLCGGGAQLLFGAFQKRFPDVSIFKEGQFANAIGFYEIGKHHFDKYDNKPENRRSTVWQIPQNI